jgi:hypothetical protein
VRIKEKKRKEKKRKEKKRKRKCPPKYNPRENTAR